MASRRLFFASRNAPSSLLAFLYNSAKAPSHKGRSRPRRARLSCKGQTFILRPPVFPSGGRFFPAMKRDGEHLRPPRCARLPMSSLAR